MRSHLPPNREKPCSKRTRLFKNKKCSKQRETQQDKEKHCLCWISFVSLPSLFKKNKLKLRQTAMKTITSLLTLAFAAELFCSGLDVAAQNKANETVKLENSYWKLTCGEKSLVSIENADDTLSTLFAGRNFGDVLVNYKVENGMWQNLSQKGRVSQFDVAHNQVLYSDTALGKTIVMTQKFSLQGESVVWDIELRNFSKFPILLGDVAPTFPWVSPKMNQYMDSENEPDPKPTELFEQNFTKHHFIEGDGSFLYYTRYSGRAPYYLWTVGKGTSLEYWNYPDRQYRAFIYSGKAGNEETHGTWRQPHTYGHLSPAGTAGDRIHFSFSFHKAASYNQMREKIYQSDLIDIRVLPAMTIPRTQYGYFSLHTKCRIDSVSAQFPKETLIEPLGKLADNTYGYRVKFSRLGENTLTVHFDGSRKTYLEYFSILSPEQMMKQRAKFLVETQQVKDSTKWFDGLYGPYDMKNGKLLTPDKPDIYDRVRTYFIASDDPALCKAPYLASKNEVFPDDAEIASVEYYLKHFVWGGLQRTDKETPYPYGVYGTPNWYINRHQDLRLTQSTYKTDTMRAWRSFDYPHIVMLYYHMYHIAKLYPEKCHYLDASGYLDRAYHTALAYFHYPTELDGEYYETFKWGCYNELLIPRLMEDLRAEGKTAYADSLRGYWERKAKFFIYDDPYPYHSEYIVDRTAYESSYALAEYALQYPMKSDKNLWYDPNVKVWYSHPNVTEKATRDFMQRQFLANLSCRGVLESEWHSLGADFNGSSDQSELSYMARMGGWAVLNYALRYDAHPNDWLSLGYASYLDPYGIMNVGDAASNYGYWYPGKEKNGAIGQAFTSMKYGHPWIGTDEDRGPWRFCGEGDLGMCAITRTATSVLVRDSLFDWVYYGGNMEKVGKNSFKLFPDDGVRQDLWLISGKSRVHLRLNRDNWSEKTPIVVDVAKRTAKIYVANALNNHHETNLDIEAIQCKPSVKMGKQTLKGATAPRGLQRYTISVTHPEETFEVAW